MMDFEPLREKLAGLPVYKIIDPVIEDVMSGKVTIVSATTGSGKSMTLPGAGADASGKQVVALVPRRFLALDSAYNVAELADITVGDKVGYAVGQINGEKSLHSDETMVLYCTYGWALKSGAINTAEFLVLDEGHEADIHISLARAILHERKKIDPSVCILETSATIDHKALAEYWARVAETAVYAIPDKALQCDVIHEPPISVDRKDGKIEQLVLGLLDEGHKGAILFRPGVKEVEFSVAELRKQLASRGIFDVEVVGMHGGSTYDERAVARRRPALGKRKIIVGTNVLETGINLLWVTAGVSDGYRKVPYHRDDTGADALVREDLPQAGLLQQIGRINRNPASSGFDRGKFILYAEKDFEARHVQNSPAIQRQSLNEVAFYAAGLGYDPTKLVWDITDEKACTLLPQRLEQAKQELMRLQLVDEKWRLTERGHFVEHLPVSPEAGALLCEAKEIDDRRRQNEEEPRVMQDAVLLAAVMETGGHNLRKDIKRGHKCDPVCASDLLDGFNAMRTICAEPVAGKVLNVSEAELAAATPESLALMRAQRRELTALCAKHNVSLNGFMDAARLAWEIASRLNRGKNDIRIETRADDEDPYDVKRYGELQRCILNASVNQLFFFENGSVRDLLRDCGTRRNNDDKPFNGYDIAFTSTVKTLKERSLVAGNLREVQKDGEQKVIVMTEVTKIPADVFISWAADRALGPRPAIRSVAVTGHSMHCAYASDGAKFALPLSSQGRKMALNVWKQYPPTSERPQSIPPAVRGRTPSYS